MDGTFSRGYDNVFRTKATILKAFQHIRGEPGCIYVDKSIKWDYAIVCNESVTVRKVTFMNVLPYYFANHFPLKVARLSDINSNSLLF